MLDTATVKSDGSVTFSGADYGREVDLVHVTKYFFVVKAKGQNSWSGRGSQKYYPTVIYVFRILERLSDNRFKLDQMLSFPVRGRENSVDRLLEKIRNA